jgi:hypothetical protein
VVNGVTYPSTITTGASGATTNSLYVSWNQPNDANVVNGGHLELQWQLNGAAGWTAWGKFDPSVSSCFVTPVSEGSLYNVQVRAVNCAGVPSPWVFAGPELVSDSLSTFSYSGIPVAPPGTLIAQGLSNGTATITALPFTPSVYPEPCTPSPATITGLAQLTTYWVYYIDPFFLGGAIAPIATQLVSDFENKAGYFLIGVITTPSYTPRYLPSTYTNLGSSSTGNPTAPYSGGISLAANVNSQLTSLYELSVDFWVYEASSGDCIWEGFPSYVTAAPMTLYVIASAVAGGAGPPRISLTAHIGGVSTLMVFLSASAGELTYSLAIPSGTNLSSISIEGAASIIAPVPGHTDLSGNANLYVNAIYIQ